MGENKIDEKEEIIPDKVVKSRSLLGFNPYRNAKTIEQKHERLTDEVFYVITHFGVVSNEGLMSHLKKTLEWLDEA